MDEKKTSLVEKITLTSVPADQRKSWPSIAFIWAGSVICIPALLVGSLISAGMNFKQSALCMVIGYVLVVFYMCLMGIQSSDLGLPATVAISRAYGKRGSSFLVSLVIAVCMIGWFAAQTSLCASSFCNITGTAVTVQIKGLTSGHSGVEIDKCRANANVLMGRLLAELSESTCYKLVALEGGARETAIAPIASCVVLADDAAAVVQKVLDLGAVFAKEYATTEPNMVVDAAAGDTQTVSALTCADTKKVAKMLVALPDSVQEMSVDMPGLVQTSTNLGLMKLTDSDMTFSTTTRSSMTTQKEWIVRKVRAIVELAGGEVTVDGNYPGWAYNPHSVVKDTVLACYKELFGKDATVDAVHAGIECGLFSDSIPNLDCVSIGPDMGDVHTPNEHLSIASTERTYRLLCAVLAKSK